MSTSTFSFRINGFSLPLHPKQLLATVAHVFVTIAFIRSVLVGLDGTKSVILAAFFGFLAVLTLVCWLICTAVDPSKNGGIQIERMAYTQKKKRYCSECRKYVFGLDHHCIWLNTCIGNRNFFEFSVMVFTVTIQAIAQTIVALLALFAWEDELSDDDKIWFIVVGIIAFLCIFFYGSLCAYRIYFFWIGKGTYDWLLEQAEREYTLPNVEHKPSPKKLPPSSHHWTQKDHGYHAQPPTTQPPRASNVFQSPVHSNQLPITNNSDDDNENIGSPTFADVVDPTERPSGYSDNKPSDIEMIGLKNSEVMCGRISSHDSDDDDSNDANAADKETELKDIVIIDPLTNEEIKQEEQEHEQEEQEYDDHDDEEDGVEESKTNEYAANQSVNELENNEIILKEELPKKEEQIGSSEDVETVEEELLGNTKQDKESLESSSYVEVPNNEDEGTEGLEVGSVELEVVGENSEKEVLEIVKPIIGDDDSSASGTLNPVNDDQ
eukprot:TRINITY_DN58982_c3_g1_i1.p1 TRINITY_DN58982_c3_g1~~TRINITY_DN58982_c3_g1_i1.p1  ORF type:complete len:494 (+),score=149.25 TRINITY_DN58982_c3_g1_i1:85-1566(+)